MLWYKLLKNTTYCGTLEASAYQLYPGGGLSGSGSGRRKGEGQSQYLKNFLDLLPRAPAVFANRLPVQPVALVKNRRRKITQGGGLGWIKPLWP